MRRCTPAAGFGIAGLAARERQSIGPGAGDPAKPAGRRMFGRDPIGCGRGERIVGPVLEERRTRRSSGGGRTGGRTAPRTLRRSPLRRRPGAGRRRYRGIRRERPFPLRSWRRESRSSGRARFAPRRKDRRHARTAARTARRTWREAPSRWRSVASALRSRDRAADRRKSYRPAAAAARRRGEDDRASVEQGSAVDPGQRHSGIIERQAGDPRTGADALLRERSRERARARPFHR